MMPIYASFDFPSPRDYLTRGKRYEVLREDSGSFDILDDSGDELYCMWSKCVHLDRGDWTRHKEPDTTGATGEQSDHAYTDLVLARAGNGGWIVRDGQSKAPLAAYSNTDDLLSGLRTLLRAAQ